MPPVRKVFGRRTVRRHVQGVDLYMPWSHLLPDYARSRPTYGQNLVDLAAALADRQQPAGEPLLVLDIGANIGDSSAQIIARTDARVLCVEGDPYWVGYLRRNLGDDPRATIEEVLLVPDTAGDAPTVGAVRTRGTTRFVATSAHEAMPALSARALREKHPAFDQLRLVKSDTDGFDPSLVPQVARAWQDRGPVLFFEFDPTLARLVDDSDPNAVWAALAELGYSRLAVWDNAGDPLGQLDIEDAADCARILEPRPIDLGYHFWDLAAARGDDAAALAAFDELMPQPYAPAPATR